MPATTMVTTSQVIEIDQITSIAVGDVFHDDVVGDYYREITFFGTPPDLPPGTTAVMMNTIPTILKVKLRASTVDPLHIEVPISEF
jgi:hypothetical protein